MQVPNLPRNKQLLDWKNESLFKNKYKYPHIGIFIRADLIAALLAALLAAVQIISTNTPISVLYAQVFAFI